MSKKFDELKQSLDSDMKKGLLEMGGSIEGDLKKSVTSMESQINAVKNEMSTASRSIGDLNESVASMRPEINSEVNTKLSHFKMEMSATHAPKPLYATMASTSGAPHLNQGVIPNVPPMMNLNTGAIPKVNSNMINLSQQGAIPKVPSNGINLTQQGATRSDAINARVTNSSGMTIPVNGTLGKSVNESSSTRVSDSDGFKIASAKKRRPLRLKDYFVTRLSPDTTEGDITNHIIDVFEFSRADISVTKLVTKYDSYASFRITCSNLEDASLFYDESKWPEGTFVKRFHTNRSFDG